MFCNSKYISSVQTFSLTCKTIPAQTTNRTKKPQMKNRSAQPMPLGASHHTTTQELDVCKRRRPKASRASPRHRRPGHSSKHLETAKEATQATQRNQSQPETSREEATSKSTLSKEQSSDRSSYTRRTKLFSGCQAVTNGDGLQPTKDPPSTGGGEGASV